LPNLLSPKFIALLAYINHFGTHRYRLNFSPSQLQALRIFVSDTSKDMGELWMSGRVYDTHPDVRERLYFQRRLMFVWEIRDHLKQHAWGQPT
jgi:hypothetical protein